MDNTRMPSELLAELEEFDTAADKIIKEFNSGLDARGSPNIIYHYTTDAGLRGILESGKLWLTESISLNDPSELSHGINQALEKIKASIPAECGKFIEHYQNLPTPLRVQGAQFFIGSFSEDGDELGQWRAYADNGRGFALAFDAKGLEGAFINADKEHSATFRVIYQNALADIHDRLIKCMLQYLSLPRNRDLAESVVNEYWRTLAGILLIAIAQASLFAKHWGYQNEKEFRFLVHSPANPPPLDVKRRYRAYEVVKFKEFDWRKLCPTTLRKIVIGPASDRTKASRYAEDCLSAFHVGDVEVIHSSIPYRIV